MAYRLKTFRVQFVAEPGEFPTGSPCRSSEEVQSLARAIYATLDADKEHFVLLVLNNKNRVNGFKVVSTGSLTASLVHPREVWRAALHLCAAAVVFVHNHPSGDPAPSREDIAFTRRMAKACEVVGIELVDHMVVGAGGAFVSMKARGGW